MGSEPISNAEMMIRLLTSIDRRLGNLERIGRRLVGPEVATEEELDGKNGDPVVKFDPDRIWKGASFKGKRFSECSPEYLDALAKGFDGSAWAKRDKGEERNARFAELDAARARGWAARLRDGWLPPDPKPGGYVPGTNPFAKPPAPPPPVPDDTDDF